MSATDLLKWLGERRDGFLIGGAVLYGLGYLVWSYNAWRNQLGQLPAAEFQYFIAGFIPAFIIAIAWAAATFFSNIQDKVMALFEQCSFLGTPVLITIVLFLIFLLWGRWISPYFMAALLSAITYLWILTTFTPKNPWFKKLLERPGGEEHALLYGRFSRVYRYLTPMLFCLGSLIIYIDLYPRLPQALGGPEPRCAYLDLVRDEIAPSSLSVLVPTGSTEAAASSKTKVVRSSKLRVYFSSSEYLLVRMSADGNVVRSADLKDVPLYELRKEVIRVIQWCESDS